MAKAKKAKAAKSELIDPAQTSATCAEIPKAHSKNQTMLGARSAATGKPRPRPWCVATVLLVVQRRTASAAADQPLAAPVEPRRPVGF